MFDLGDIWDGITGFFGSIGDFFSGGSAYDDPSAYYDGGMMPAIPAPPPKISTHPSSLTLIPLQFPQAENTSPAYSGYLKFPNFYHFTRLI